MSDKPKLEELYEQLTEKHEELGRLMVSYSKMKVVAEGSNPINPDLVIPDALQTKWKSELVPVCNEQGTRILELWGEINQVTLQATSFIHELNNAAPAS